jgi:hypothetical protein
VALPPPSIVATAEASSRQAPGVRPGRRGDLRVGVPEDVVEDERDPLRERQPLEDGAGLGGIECARLVRSALAPALMRLHDAAA